MIDFHGRDDWTVPLQYDHSPGEGPIGDVRTIMSWDGLYYYYKPEYMDFIADAYKCSAWESWPTSMDGVNGWRCLVRQQCQGGVQVNFVGFVPYLFTFPLQIVSCTGDHGHVYPFNESDHPEEAARILWEFFAANPSKTKTNLTTH